MELEHEFTVPLEIGEAWAALLDVRRIACCLPGAFLTDVCGDEFTGAAQLSLGPVEVTYDGRARIVEKNDAARRIVARLDGRERVGAGVARATVTATLTPDGYGFCPGTAVHVRTDLAVTGVAARFGRGVLQDLGGRLASDFAANLGQVLRTSAPSLEGHDAAQDADAVPYAVGNAAAVPSSGKPPTVVGAVAATVAGANGAGSVATVVAGPARTNGTPPARSLSIPPQRTAAASGPRTPSQAGRLSPSAPTERSGRDQRSRQAAGLTGGVGRAPTGRSGQTDGPRTDGPRTDGPRRSDLWTSAPVRLGVPLAALAGAVLTWRFLHGRGVPVPRRSTARLPRRGGQGPRLLGVSLGSARTQPGRRPRLGRGSSA